MRSKVNTCRACRRAVLADYRHGNGAIVLVVCSIQGVERKQSLRHLAPERRLISAEAIEREFGQIGQPQKATR
jgi:hypothetical protein